VSSFEILIDGMVVVLYQKKKVQVANLNPPEEVCRFYRYDGIKYA